MFWCNISWTLCIVFSETVSKQTLEVYLAKRNVFWNYAKFAWINKVLSKSLRGRSKSRFQEENATTLCMNILVQKLLEYIVVVQKLLQCFRFYQSILSTMHKTLPELFLHAIFQWQLWERKFYDIKPYSYSGLWTNVKSRKFVYTYA